MIAGWGRMTGEGRMMLDSLLSLMIEGTGIALNRWMKCRVFLS